MTMIVYGVLRQFSMIERPWALNMPDKWFENEVKDIKEALHFCKEHGMNVTSFEERLDEAVRKRAASPEPAA